jgi:hypothetical protein
MTPWRALLTLWGRVDIDPTQLGWSVTARDFQKYLDFLKVHFFSAEEMLTPYQPKKTTHTYLLPPLTRWERGGALAVFSDKLRQASRSPVFMRNWFRPDDYNRSVGGSPNSDHIHSCAVDLDFLDNEARLLALHYLDRYVGSGLLKLSIGTAVKGTKGTTIHVGLWAPATHARSVRRWYY